MFLTPFYLTMFYLSLNYQNQIFLTRTLFTLICMTQMYQVRNLIAKASAFNIQASVM